MKINMEQAMELQTRAINYDTLEMYSWIKEAKQWMAEVIGAAKLEAGQAEQTARLDAAYKLTADKAAAVCTETKWRKLTADTPMGAKMLLINRDSGVALVTTNVGNGWWTHWCPLPTFETEEES